MRRRKLVALVMPLLVLMAFGASALANGGTASIRARLKGYEAVPAVNTTGTGTFSATVNTTGTMITYTLSYSGLSSPAIASHIHFGQRGVVGGAVAFLCGGGTKPPCPPSGTVTGTIVPSDIMAVPTQGIAAGDMASVLRAMRAGVAYVNVHTTNFPGEEIRGQIKFEEEEDNQD